MGSGWGSVALSHVSQGVALGLVWERAFGPAIQITPGGGGWMEWGGDIGTPKGRGQTQPGVTPPGMSVRSTHSP